MTEQDIVRLRAEAILDRSAQRAYYRARRRLRPNARSRTPKTKTDRYRVYWKVVWGYVRQEARMDSGKGKSPDPALWRDWTGDRLGLGIRLMPPLDGSTRDISSANHLERIAKAALAHRERDNPELPERRPLCLQVVCEEWCQDPRRAHWKSALEKGPMW